MPYDDMSRVSAASLGISPSGTSSGSGTGNATGTDWNSLSKWGGVLQGVGTIFDGYAGYKQYQLGKDQLAFNREAFDFNKGMSVAAALAQAQGRLSSMQAYGSKQDMSYLTNLISTLKSYGTDSNKTTMFNEDSINNPTFADQELARRGAQQQQLLEQSQNRMQGLSGVPVDKNPAIGAPVSQNPVQALPQPVPQNVNNVDRIAARETERLGPAPSIRSADDLRFNRR